MNKADLIKLKRLHKLAQTIQEKKPWDFFEDIGIFAVSLVGRNTPFYCVFLQDTIIVCPNEAALSGLLYLNAQQKMPQVQRFRYQQHLALYFERLENISSRDYELLMTCDVEPVNHLYPVFESVMPTIMPDQLVQREIQIMIDILKQVDESMAAMDELLALEHDINEHIVHRYFDFEQSKWVFGLLDMINFDVKVPPYQLAQTHIDQINEQPHNEDVIEIDVAYTPVMMEPKPGHRQGVIRVLVIGNHHQKEVHHQQLITLQEEAHLVLVQQLVDYIKAKGIMKQLIVRDDIIASLLQDFNKQFNIEIITKQQLPTIDYFVSEFIFQTLH